MSFEAYLKAMFGKSDALNEAKKKSDQDNLTGEIKNLIDSGIGGDLKSTEARENSFESIRQILEKLDISTLDKLANRPDLQKAVTSLADPDKIDWVNEYLKKAKRALSDILSEKKKLDTTKSFSRYRVLKTRETEIQNRIYKIYRIFQYTLTLPEVDQDAQMLDAIKGMGERLKSSAEEGAETYLISKIGGIDNVVPSDEFTVIDSTGKETTLKKEELGAILDANPEIAEKAKRAASDSHRKKIAKLFERAEAAIKKEVSNSINYDVKKIEEIPVTEEGQYQLNIDWKPLIDVLGYNRIYAKPVKDKEEQLIKIEKPSARRKNRIKEKLMSALKFSLLPPLSNGEIIEPGGDYFKLFKRLEKENSPWMESALSEVLVDYDRLSQFNNSGRVKESALEEDQLAYLKASTSWIIKYIRSEVDGDLVEKSREVAVEKIKNISIEKEKEIKNHYLSRDFNMSNFRGIQLKPGLRLPLYTKVKLAVSEEDRIKESPLRNVIKGFGQLLAGALSTIPDRGDAAVAARNAAQNQAIFNGISNIVKGVVLAVGGKQAGRDYEKGMEKVTTKAGTGAIGLEPYKKANEDAAAPSAPGVALQTPDTLVGDNMDTFALSGPGKKEKKKKIATKVSSFKDFLKLNK